MDLGFTGTRNGLSPVQEKSLLEVLTYFSRAGFVWLHHGDCEGADATAHKLWTGLGRTTWGHPPDAAIHRAFCKCDRLESAKPYLYRNMDIVVSSEVVIGTPFTPIPSQKSGTWMTLRFAQKLKKPIIMILPNGSVVRRDG